MVKEVGALKRFVGIWFDPPFEKQAVKKIRGSYFNKNRDYFQDEDIEAVEELPVGQAVRLDKYLGLLIVRLS